MRLIKSIASSFGGNSIAQPLALRLHHGDYLMNILSLFYLLCVVLTLAGGLLVLASGKTQSVLIGFVLSCFGVSGLFALLGFSGLALLQLLLGLSLPSITLLQFFFPFSSAASVAQVKSVGSKLVMGVLAIILALTLLAAAGLSGRHALEGAALPGRGVEITSEVSPVFVIIFFATTLLSACLILAHSPHRRVAANEELQPLEKQL